MIEFKINFRDGRVDPLPLNTEVLVMTPSSCYAAMRIACKPIVCRPYHAAVGSASGRGLNVSVSEATHVLMMRSLTGLPSLREMEEAVPINEFHSQPLLWCLWSDLSADTVQTMADIIQIMSVLEPADETADEDDWDA